MKKILLLLFLTIFSISFTAQYEISKKSSVKMTKSEMEKNASLIEKSIKNTFTETGLGNHFKRVEDKYKIGTNLETEIYNKFMSKTFSTLVANAQVTLVKIEFLSEKKAEITVKYKTPTIDAKSISKFDKTFKDEFKRQMGYPFEKINEKVLSYSDRKKIDNIISSTVSKNLKSDLKNPVYSSGESREIMEKVNGNWRFIVK